MLREKFIQNAPDSLMSAINSFISINNLKIEDACKIIRKVIKKNPYTWYKTQELPDRITPLYYVREPNSFQADDYCISRHPNSEEFVASQYKNSIEEKILGNDVDLDSIKRRLFRYVILKAVKEEFGRLTKP